MVPSSSPPALASRRRAVQEASHRTGASGRRPGRPRTAGTDEQLLAAAQRLLGEQGYARMSLEGVARAAGVSKPTLYRRWSNKADLATAAVAAIAAQEPDPDTGDAHEDLVQLTRHLRQGFLRPHGPSTLGTVLAEEHETPELLARFRERLVAPRRQRYREVLDRGVRRGQVRADADLDAAVNAIVGSLYGRYLEAGDVDDDWPARIVALVWPAIAA